MAPKLSTCRSERGFSPNKDLVDAAVKYADSKGVLMVHAAGNDGENLSQSPSFPTPTYRGGGKATNWIEVGASRAHWDESSLDPAQNIAARKRLRFLAGR